MDNINRIHKIQRIMSPGLGRRAQSLLPGYLIRRPELTYSHGLARYFLLRIGGEVCR